MLLRPIGGIDLFTDIPTLMFPMIWFETYTELPGNLFKVPMVLNPHGIEPTFLKLDSWSPGAGFITIIIYSVL